MVDVETWGTSQGHSALCRAVGRRHWSVQMQGQDWSPIPNVQRENLLVPWDRTVGNRDKLPPAAQVAKQLPSSLVLV